MPEFRRTGQAGGGWTGTFDDVASAVDLLAGLVVAATGEDVVNGDPPLLAGHSAGGHLALWAAARHRLPLRSPWRTHAAGARRGQRTPSIRGVVALAAVSDLGECHRLRLGQGAATDLIGDGPNEEPERYRAADPSHLLPLGCPIRLIHGTADDRVPSAMSGAFAARARAAGDDVRLDELPAVGHFDVIDPLSEAWPQVLAAFESFG